MSEKRFSIPLLIGIGVPLFLFLILLFPSRLLIQRNLLRIAVLKAYQQERSQVGALEDLAVQAASLQDYATAGMVLFQTGDYAGSSEYLRQAVMQSPRDPVVQFFLGWDYFRMGQAERARGEWQKTNPGLYSRYFVMMAEQADHNEDPAQVLAYAEMALELDQNNGEAYYYLGHGYMLQEAWTDALENLELALPLMKEDGLRAMVYREMGKISNLQGNHVQSSAYLERALELTTLERSYHLRLELAREYIQLSRYDDARAQLTTAQKIDPQDPGVLIRLGDISAAQEKKEEALTWYRKAIDVEPETGRGEYAIGKYLLTSGDPRGAVPYLERATQLGWDYRWVWGDLGKAYRASGDIENAIKTYRIIIERSDEPESIKNSWIAIAQMNTEKQDTDAAYDAWEAVLEIDPDNPFALKALEGRP